MGFHFGCGSLLPRVGIVGEIVRLFQIQSKLPQLSYNVISLHGWNLRIMISHSLMWYCCPTILMGFIPQNGATFKCLIKMLSRSPHLLKKKCSPHYVFWGDDYMMVKNWLTILSHTEETTAVLCGCAKTTRNITLITYPELLPKSCLEPGQNTSLHARSLVWRIASDLHCLSGPWAPAELALSFLKSQQMAGLSPSLPSSHVVVCLF